jgi:hypothetical protein
MKRKGLLFLVLATLIAGGAFAQNVGDTLNAFGKNYTVKEIRDGEVILRLTPTLDGTWKSEGGSIITFNGNTAVFKQISSSALFQDAVKKGYLKVGGQIFRNLKKTDDLTWSCQKIGIQSYTDAPNVAIGAVWGNCTIKLSANSKTFTEDNGATWTRQ